MGYKKQSKKHKMFILRKNTIKPISHTLNKMERADLFKELDTEINDLLTSQEENAIAYLERHSKRKNGKPIFNLYFTLYKISQSKLPETRILTIKKLANMTGIHRKVVGDYMPILEGLKIFIVSTGHGKGNRRENKIVVKELKEWDEGDIAKIISIYNWNKEKWE